MTLSELLHHRRAVRYFDPEKPLDSEKVTQYLQLATLAPSSSNMQLYEFYHITDKALLAQLATACLGQQTATTAQQMVVFVTRQDLYKQRAQAVLAFESENIKRHSPPDRWENRLKGKTLYYAKLMPFIYARCFGLLGLFRKGLAYAIRLFRPVSTEVSEADVRVVVHKSCGLAAQTFMLLMAEQGYDTCPIEGLDGGKVKKLLSLPQGAEINMIVSCGVRKAGRGIWGDRFRVPFDEVYHRK
ncbi:nitroreductase family protein [Pasteurella multocida]|uniref:nitroreductase family protein n=1 Tax=Pasteurella multocida TaxID=747 RepID=UPI00147E4801|nr:nitroreductase family protein [Pasteurella multocida]NNH92574.1 nitroreductase family protein [Pasteurella multocida]